MKYQNCLFLPSCLFFYLFPAFPSRSTHVPSVFCSLLWILKCRLTVVGPVITCKVHCDLHLCVLSFQVSPFQLAALSSDVAVCARGPALLNTASRSLHAAFVRRVAVLNVGDSTKINIRRYCPPPSRTRRAVVWSNGCVAAVSLNHSSTCR